MSPKRLEEVSLNSWPALQQMFFDGWVLRFANGYTKRANSINPLFVSTLDVFEKVTTCERIYREKGLRPVFRLTPFSSPSNIDDVLEQRHYKVIDETLVLHLDLSNYEGRNASSHHLQIKPLDEWLRIFCELKGSSIESHQTHKTMLELIPSTRLPATLVNEGGIPVASAMGVLENEYFGLFDMVTGPEYRKKGYGTQLVSSMLQWAQQNGARHAYLQVVRANSAARRLYDKIGYQQVYRYWYRVPKNQ